MIQKNIQKTFTGPQLKMGILLYLVKRGLHVKSSKVMTTDLAVSVQGTYPGGTTQLEADISTFAVDNGPTEVILEFPPDICANATFMDEIFDFLHANNIAVKDDAVGKYALCAPYGRETFFINISIVLDMIRAQYLGSN